MKFTNKIKFKEMVYKKRWLYNCNYFIIGEILAIF